MDHEDGSTFPAEVLRSALEEVRVFLARERDEGRSGEWCLPRQVSSVVKQRGGNEEGSNEKTQAEPSLLPQTGLDGSAVSGTWRCRDALILSASSSEGQSKEVFYHVKDIVDRLVSNPTAASLCVAISPEAAEERSQHRYIIPPAAHFLLSQISMSTTPAFSMAAYTHLPTATASAGPGQFDFILLDPPWSNRSARRSKAYEVESKDHTALDALLPTLGPHLGPGGFLGCWITNRRASRRTALDAFEAWDLELEEEWAWLKVTTQGDPTCQIESLWRKPYETLLLGRRRSNGGGLEVEEKRKQGPLKRRVIIAVPDLHSRKPCLKDIIEKLVLDGRTYRTLEVFGRNLASGWWTWGEEVLKFNWRGYWL